MQRACWAGLASGPPRLGHGAHLARHAHELEAKAALHAQNVSCGDKIFKSALSLLTELFKRRSLQSDPVSAAIEAFQNTGGSNMILCMQD